MKVQRDRETERVNKMFFKYSAFTEISDIFFQSLFFTYNGILKSSKERLKTIKLEIQKRLKNR